ncbi:MAG: hypothetical protein KA444_02105 [Bacteroidia bacterium]|nr:hypothetical protein [Bacteroidia bacterium]
MKIENYTDLKLEIVRLEKKSKEQELALLEKVHALRQSFSAQNIIMNSLSSFTGIPLNKAEFMRKGILVAITFIVQKLFKKSELKLENVITEWFTDFTTKVKEFFKSKFKPEENLDREDF